MKKSKIVKSTKLQTLEAAYATYKEAAQKFMYSLPSAELIAITNLLSQGGEKLYLVPQVRFIIGYAVKDPARAPIELL